jgi:hypothetical protein
MELLSLLLKKTAFISVLLQFGTFDAEKTGGVHSINLYRSSPNWNRLKAGSPSYEAHGY